MQLVSPIVSYFKAQGYTGDYTDPVAEQSKAIVTQIDNNTPSGRIYFKADPELDYSTIRAIEIVTTSSLSAQAQIRSATGDFFPNISNAQAARLAFGLAKNDHIIAKISLTSMVRFLNSGKFCPVNSSDHIWQDCFIEVNDNTGINAGQCVMVIVYFDKDRTV
jgi:hypothetical protein